MSCDIVVTPSQPRVVCGQVTLTVEQVDQIIGALGGVG
jgi:hypothetical protein